MSALFDLNDALKMPIDVRRARLASARLGRVEPS